MGDLHLIPAELRGMHAERVRLALKARVNIDDVKSFIDPNDKAANSRLREQVASMLTGNDELWWFSTSFQSLSGMAGYACLRGEGVVDYIVVVQS